MIKELKIYDLGLKRKTVEMHESSADWGKAFGWVSQKLSEALLAGQTNFNIHHIGSTSFGEIKAKPILDVMVVLENFDQVQDAIKALEGLGFTYKGDILSRLYSETEQPDRHFFSLYDDNKTTDYVHLHMLVAGHPDIQKYLTFRGRMRSDPKLRQSYEDLKVDLKTRGATRREYTVLKSQFVADVLASEDSQVSFAPMKESHLHLWEKWADIPHVKEVWFIDGYETTDYIHQKIAGNGYDYPFVIELNGKPIGYIQCCDLYVYRTKCENPKGLFINEEPGTFCLDLFIAEESLLNKGLGTKIINQFTQKLLSEFKTQKILIDPAASNKRAIRCYEKCGYRVIREQNDGVTDCVIMEYFSYNPPANLA